MSWDDYVPVLPYADEGGRLVSLQRMLGDEQAGQAMTYPPLGADQGSSRRLASLTLKQLREKTEGTANAFQYQTLGAEGRWSVSRVSASFAAKAGYGGLFSTQNEAFGDVMVADALVGYRCVRQAETDGDLPLVYGTFWGYSVRLVVKVSGFRSGTQLDLPTVAARAALGHIDAEYSLEGLGGTLSLFSSLLAKVPAIGKFDQNVLESISGGSRDVLASIVAQLVDEEARLLPIRVGVSLDTMPRDSVSEARSKRFAMLILRQKATLEETLRFARRKQLLSGTSPKLSASAIKDAFRLIMGDGLNGPVSDAHVRAAEEWLNV